MREGERERELSTTSEMAVTMSAAATMMVAPAQAAVSSRNLSSSSSVAFNNGGVRSVNMVASRRPMKSLGVRAREIEDDRVTHLIHLSLKWENSGEGTKFTIGGAGM